MPTVLNLFALALGLGSAILLARSPDPLLDVLAAASSPTVVNVGRGPDMTAISQLGMEVRTGAEKSRRRVRLGCVGLGVSFVLQAVALFL
jgi:hypothetical protein